MAMGDATVVEERIKSESSRGRFLFLIFLTGLEMVGSLFLNLTCKQVINRSNRTT